MSKIAGEAITPNKIFENENGEKWERKRGAL